MDVMVGCFVRMYRNTLRTLPNVGMDRLRVRVCAGSDGQWGRGKVHLQGIAVRDQTDCT